MRKLVLTLCLMVMSTVAFAECITTEDKVMWLDVDRYALIAKIGKSNYQQGLSLALDDIKTGKAVRLEKGTKIDNVFTIPDSDEVCVISIKNQGLVGLLKGIKCN